MKNATQFYRYLFVMLNCARNAIKLSNCSHTNEKGCAILAAIKSGDLTEKRYKNYLKMKKRLS